MAVVETKSTSSLGLEVDQTICFSVQQANIRARVFETKDIKLEINTLVTVPIHMV